MSRKEASLMLVLAVLSAAGLFGAASAQAACAPLDLFCREPAPAPAPAPQPGLAVAITESDPHLIAPDGPPGFAGARGDLAALKPRYVRVLVDWTAVQPSGAISPDWDRKRDGCVRGTPPCESSAGIRDLLKAIGRRQKSAGSGWEVMVVPYFTPRWAASKRRGCERDKTSPRARMPRIAAYRGFVRSMQAISRETDVKIAYWSPWNEPNHPAFLNPQRATCSVTSPTLGPMLYAKLARVMRAELEQGQQLVIGELAGIDEARTYGSSVEEFSAALPADIACAGASWGQHHYVGKQGKSRGRGKPRAPAPIADPATAARMDLLAAVDRGYAGKGCAPPPIWMTETGAFDHRCEAMAAALATWARSGRVAAAFQYTYREDPAYPVGLIDTALKDRRAAYDAWAAASRDGAAEAERGCS